MVTAGFAEALNDVKMMTAMMTLQTMRREGRVRGETTSLLTRSGCAAARVSLSPARYEKQLKAAKASSSKAKIEKVQAGAKAKLERKKGGGASLNRAANLISRLALSLPPCTRERVECMPSAL